MERDARVGCHGIIYYNRCHRIQIQSMPVAVHEIDLYKAVSDYSLPVYLWYDNIVIW